MTTSECKPVFEEKWLVEDKQLGELVYEHGFRALGKGLVAYADWLDSQR
ncbi:hypothetical protein GCM10025751_04700 [Haladaptatus pallidirubidus]|uniref:Uncharacterized protein n=2 Tax=Haladaptatus pallidirubidus TaxID=1008152 RepID=A0AAV3UCZ4_9EURY